MYTDLVSFEHIPILGSGLGYREPWYESLISASGDKVDFLEITADHFMDAPNWKIDQLKELSEKFTLIPHALDLSLGTSEGINEAYIEKLQSVIEIVNPPYWSEHLAFTKAGGMELGHLAPLPFSNEAIDVVAEIGDTFIRLFDGGWQTNTTKSRLNAILSEHGESGDKVFQKDFDWFVQMNTTQGLSVVPFFSSMRLG